MCSLVVLVARLLALTPLSPLDLSLDRLYLSLNRRRDLNWRWGLNRRWGLDRRWGTAWQRVGFICARVYVIVRRRRAGDRWRVA